MVTIIIYKKYLFILGGGGVGKSCLTVRMLQGTYMVTKLIFIMSQGTYVYGN